MNVADKRAYWLQKGVDRAIRELGMLRDGDRVAVAVSGGKDSLALLRLLDLRRRTCRERYRLVALHVIGDARGPDTPRHRPLEDWLREAGYAAQVAYGYLPPGEPLPLSCQRCTWNRRRTLFELAAAAGCNVLAYGHHADDLAETTLLNLLFHGRVETMAPVREYFDGRLRLIRPLCLIEERDLRSYARVAGFPEPPLLCPQAERGRRALVRQLIRQAQAGHPGVRSNLLRAGLAPLGL